MIEANTINNLDCLDGLAQMPDGCAKLIVADPPYFMGLTHNGQHGQFNDLAVANFIFLWTGGAARSTIRFLPNICQ